MTKYSIPVNATVVVVVVVASLLSHSSNSAITRRNIPAR
jgi:hypothetical protein